MPLFAAGLWFLTAELPHPQVTERVRSGVLWVIEGTVNGIVSGAQYTATAVSKTTGGTIGKRLVLNMSRIPKLLTKASACHCQYGFPVKRAPEPSAAPCSSVFHGAANL